MTDNLKMSLSISRVHCNIEGDYVSIEVKDENACVKLLRLKMSMENFAQAITGLHSTECVGEVSGLDKVGKKHENRDFSFELPEGTKFRDKTAAVKAVMEACPKGWTPDISFSSQNSFYSADGKEWARTTIRRWVEIEE